MKVLVACEESQAVCKACQTKEEAIQERLKLEQKICGEFLPKR